MSPLLFIVYMDKFKKEANPALEALNELLFSDDQSLINEDEKAIQAWTHEQSECCIEAYEKEISFSKTETMKVIRTPGDLAISINGTKFKQVK